MEEKSELENARDSLRHCVFLSCLPFPSLASFVCSPYLLRSLPVSLLSSLASFLVSFVLSFVSLPLLARFLLAGKAVTDLIPFTEALILTVVVLAFILFLYCCYVVR